MELSANTLVITTFSKDGYHLYGKKMIETWCKFWPSNYKLRIYAEHDLQINDHRVEVVNLNDASVDLLIFKNNASKLLKSAQGKKPRNNINRTVKWCHKVYAIKHALQNNQHTHLIFLDGDTYTKDFVENNQIESLVNNHLFAVHFEHLFSMLHYETGLIIFNLRHKQITHLTENITTAYDNFDIFSMKKGWDGFWLAKLATDNNYDVTNLATHGGGVFANPVVKKILVHNVGPKKYIGTGYDKYTGKRK